MATTITIPTPNIHWLTYPILVGLVFGAVWLWHDTRIKDAAALKAVTAAKSTQQTTDKQVASADKVAQASLQTKNAKLQATLASAKTTKQQIDVVNMQAGTQIDDHQAQNPSSMIQITADDIRKLAGDETSLAINKNQVAADQIVIAGDKLQIAARDETIDTQNKEITTLKGGSHLKRFFTAAKHVAIGAGIGVVTGILIDRQVK